MTEGFVQDSWKATSKLHLDFGVRYTVIVPYSSLWRNMIVFDPSLYDPSKAVSVNPTTGFVNPGNGDRYNGMVIPGNGWPSSAIGRVPEATTGTYNYLFRGITNHYSDIQWGQFQPRVGLAYQLTPKTVIRAGGGRFFSRVGVSDSVFLGGNPPFQPTTSVIAGNADNPGGTSAAKLSPYGDNPEQELQESGRLELELYRRARIARQLCLIGCLRRPSRASSAA